MRPTSSYQLRATLAVLLLFFSCLALASSESKDASNTLSQRDEEAGSGCSTEGQWHCGHWSIKMAMAEGTKCEPAGYTNDYNFRIEHDGQGNGDGRAGGQSSRGSNLGSRASASGITIVVISCLCITVGSLC
ncbi:hypothetical protein LB504_001008 [Fusarium proliferatum]|nr:hypothetical protein LB504_001008 [Fusarium proliferatum]